MRESPVSGALAMPSNSQCLINDSRFLYWLQIQFLVLLLFSLSIDAKMIKWEKQQEYPTVIRQC